MASRDVDRRRRSAAGVRVPWSAPRRDSRLERADNLVGEFLVVVASLCGMASEVSHLAAPRNGIVPENSLPTLAGRPAGQGRASGPGETSEAARPAEPLRRRASMRDRSLSVLLPVAASTLFSSWMNMLPIPGTRCARGLAPDNGRHACNCCIAALRYCGAGSRPYMPSLGVSSLDSRPPQGGLLFGDDRKGQSDHDAQSCRRGVTRQARSFADSQGWP